MIYLNIGIFLLLFKLLSTKELIIVFLIRLFIYFLDYQFPMPYYTNFINLYSIIWAIIVLLAIAKGIKNNFQTKV